ncbi:MAG TPA: beta-N-acetylhexosaminidase [Polyangiaceae bacterium]|nr:beta-N-acetylhexosaminidase [Polyangiaceae bacterium]
MALDRPASPAHYAAAQLLTVGFYDTTLNSTLKELLDRGVGGVVLFARNISSPEQVGKLIHDIKAYAGRPLFVGLDQEGGLVQRLKDGFTRIPPMRAIGALADVELAEQLGRFIGTELRAVGVDVNFAPILDVDTNPLNPIIGNRSFSRDPELVGRLGVALGRGLEAAGVASCGKHFPGHGDTAQDSHQELPSLPHSLERLEAVELVPFRAWTAANLASIMTAHVIFEPLDPDYPATMSRRVLHGILRERLGYQGLIITDDIEMKAIADHYGYEEAAIRGVNAGVDNFLCCHTADVAHRIIDTLVEAVTVGRIGQARIDDAGARVRAFAERWARPAEEPQLDRLQSPEFGALIERVLSSVDPAQAHVGEDPTEIMEQIRVERAQRELAAQG